MTQRFLKVNTKKYQSYIDLSKIFRFVIVPFNDYFKLRAEFLVAVDINPNSTNKIKNKNAYFQDIDSFNSIKEAEDFIESLFPNQVEIIQESKEGGKP